jgi:FtsH-binding integral membrane protein
MTLFLKKLSLVALFLLIVLVALGQFQAFKEGLYFNLIGLAYLYLVSLFSFLMMKRAVESENNSDFMLYSAAAFAGKFFLSITFVAVYFFIWKPEGKYFILPFFLMYLIFSGLIAFDTKRIYRITKDGA